MRETLDAATVREWGERYSNQGRWGRNDVLGTLNFINAERVRAACALPRRGLVISCALPSDRRAARADEEAGGAQRSGAGAACEPGAASAARMDASIPALYTQWNPRARVFCPRHPPGPHGAERRQAAALWRDPIQDGVVGRGVLLDHPRFLRHPWLDEGTRILPHDLDNCAEAMGVTVERGDVVLLRTGQLTRYFLEGSWRSYRDGAAPGLSLHWARWLHEREVAAVASDTWNLEVTPNETDACDQPLQEIALGRTGLLIGKSFHLDTLSEACAADGEYAFLFTAPLLPALGSVGYPINPLAIK